MAEEIRKIEIEKEVDDKINWFTHNYEQEISGWLVGEFTKDLITITDILIRSEEHTSELQSHSFISYAVFCLKKKKK